MFKFKISFFRKIFIIYEMLGREEILFIFFFQEVFCFVFFYLIFDGEDFGNEVGEVLGFKLDVLCE